MPLVAQHQFVAILRAQGWRAPLIGTWTRSGVGVGTAPDGATARWVPPADSDDANEKGTWSSVWVAELGHPDVAMAAGVAGLGEDVLRMPLGPQGRHRLERLPALLEAHGLGEVAALDPPWVVVGGARVHLASGAVELDGALRPRDAALAPVAGVDDPGLGRVVAEVRRLAARVRPSP